VGRRPAGDRHGDSEPADPAPRPDPQYHFITGNLPHFVEGLAARLVPRPADKLDAAFAIFGMTWLGYAIGAALGAAAFTTLAMLLIAPAAGLMGIYWLARGRDKLSTSGL
jgi:uncharacterized membrane protein YoaK (UPF0700 family)